MSSRAETYKGPIDINHLPEHRRSFALRDGYVYVVRVVRTA